LQPYDSRPRARLRPPLAAPRLARLRRHPLRCEDRRRLRHQRPGPSPPRRLPGGTGSPAPSSRAPRRKASRAPKTPPAPPRAPPPLPPSAQLLGQEPFEPPQPQQVRLPPEPHRERPRLRQQLLSLRRPPQVAEVPGEVQPQRQRQVQVPRNVELRRRPPQVRHRPFVVLQLFSRLCPLEQEPRRAAQAIPRTGVGPAAAMLRGPASGSRRASRGRPARPPATP
jgi:hypothetical protein